MAYGPAFYGMRTPHFMPYEPFLLGVGVVFNLLTSSSSSGKSLSTAVPERWSMLTKRSISYSSGDLHGGGVGGYGGPRKKQCDFQNTKFSPRISSANMQP